ncbi:MAG: DUF1579 family protein [Burkholderiales bacterium]|nr:DUF1579 family protein [Burkholderiales bacterium]
MMSQNFEIPAQPTAAERKLDVLAGRWRTTGKSVTAHGFAGGKMDLQENYEWLPGNVMMLHAWTGEIGGETCKGVEVITHDGAKGKYFSHMFTNPNIGRVYEMTVDAAGVWTITGPTERGRLVFDTEDSLTGVWEYSGDGIKWEPLCEFQMKRTG